VHVLYFTHYFCSLCSTLIRIVQADRNSQLISLDTKKLVQEAIQVFVQLGDWHQLFPLRPGEEMTDIGDIAIHVYTADFETAFLSSSAQHFADLASRWIASESCPDYLRCIDQLKANEILLCSAYLHPSSLNKLLSQIEEVCLYAHRDSMMDTPSCGLEIMLRDGLLPELSLMYSILNGLHPSSERKIIPHMVTRFKNHIRQVGSQFLDQWCANVGEKEPVDLIPQLLDLYIKYHAIVFQAFKEDSQFSLAMKETFEFFTNKRVGMFSIAELLAMHCDVTLRKGGSMTDSELPLELDRIVGLFQYISDKDEFAEHFKKHLAIRLLMQRSSSEENECSLIGRLKQKCGSAYTSKLEAMLRDVELSQNISSAFLDSLDRQDKTCPVSSFNLYILTTGCWPSYSHDEFSLPPVMAEALKMFSEDFASKPQNNQKRLRWVHSLGSVSINFTAKKKKYELIVSTAQASLLCLFNESSVLTREQMKEQTGFPLAMFDDVLESCSTKWPLLVIEGETVRINDDFESTKRKISMIMQEKRAAPAERAGTRAALDDDRKFAVEACVMRLMKSRKVMRHPDLVQEINAQLMKLFKPDQRVRAFVCCFQFSIV
jgi:cullin 1